jgi:predicted amidohydrolase
MKMSKFSGRSAGDRSRLARNRSSEFMLRRYYTRMRVTPWLIAAAALLASPRAAASGPDNLVTPSCWEAFAPRAVNAPASSKSVDGGDAVLALSSRGKPFVYGGWRCHVEGIAGGGHYQFHALAVPEGIESLRESVSLLLRWKGDFGDEVAPAYVWDGRPAGRFEPGVLFERLVKAPGKATAVDVELVLQWSATGRVSWREVSLAAAPGPPVRAARVATVAFRPRGTASGAESAARAAAFADTVAAAHHPDVLLLGEVINHTGSPGSLDQDAETIPGPTTDRFAELARRRAAYVAFSLLERSGDDIFNTGVLIDRRGGIALKYRKAQLPFEEVSLGEAPGNSFPVVDTDFGRVGLLICHDTSFVEPARELARQGAELILIPIAGGRTTLVRARAVENGVYLATSGYDYDSEIVDPVGRVMASAPHHQGPSAAVADLDLNGAFPEEWLGNWHDTVSKQRRDGLFGRESAAGAAPTAWRAYLASPERLAPAVVPAASAELERRLREASAASRDDLVRVFLAWHERLTVENGKTFFNRRDLQDALSSIAAELPGQAISRDPLRALASIAPARRRALRARAPEAFAELERYAASGFDFGQGEGSWYLQTSPGFVRRVAERLPVSAYREYLVFRAREDTLDGDRQPAAGRAAAQRRLARWRTFRHLHPALPEATTELDAEIQRLEDLVSERHRPS